MICIHMFVNQAVRAVFKANMAIVRQFNVILRQSTSSDSAWDACQWALQTQLFVYMGLNAQVVEQKIRFFTSQTKT